MASVQAENSISAELSSKLWYEAKQNLSNEEREHIRDFHDDKCDNHEIVNDVLKTAKEKQKEAEDRNWTFKRSDGRVIVVREIFSKIVDSITKFQGAVDFLVSMDASGNSALPWAGVKLLLSDSQKWGSVIEGMEFITREISYYGIFEVIYLRRKFSATKQLSDALVRAYTKILQFLSGARRYYDQNSLKRFLSTMTSLEDTLSDIVSAIKSERGDIERLRGIIDGQQEKEIGDGITILSQDQKTNQSKLVGLLTDLAAPMENITMQLMNVRDELSEIRAEMKVRNEAEELSRIYKHLQPEKITNYETKVGNLTPGTATWILENKTFKEWLEGKISTLFVYGGPGTGKSHLSTKIIDYLRKTPLGASQRQNRIGYYYFEDNDKSTRSVFTAICVIVYQIAAEDDIYRMHAAQICNRSPNFAMATCGTVWNDFLAAEHGATSDNQLFLIFDGIDEAEREGFVEFLKLLSTSVLQKHRIQALLVGRPEMGSIIRERFGGIPYGIIEVSSKVNINDIRKFCQAKYDELIRVKTFKGLRHKVIETLTEKADGMFLWVDLIYKEELQDILSPIRLKEALENLPEGGLFNLYDHIFLRLERDNGPGKRLALQELFCWTTYFKEPLSLFYLNDILSLLFGNQFSDVEAILDTCASLFILIKTGEVLLEELNQSENEIPESSNYAHQDSEQTWEQGNAQPELEENYADEEEEAWGENYDDEKEMAEMVEANEQHRNRQREIFVHLRHASLGDYLRRADLKPTTILLGPKQGQVHIVITMLQIICKGADAPENLWFYLMVNFVDQIASLDCSMASETEIKLIIGYLYDIFTSGKIGRHLAKVYAGDEAVTILTNTSATLFGFGANKDLDLGSDYLGIRRWLQAAQNTKLIEWDSDISNWVTQILDHPSKLLVPLVKICISEWLSCKASIDELYIRCIYLWQFILSTDLVPPVTKTEIGPKKIYDIYSDGAANFLGGNPFIFLAGLSNQHQTIEMHVVVARTISYVDPGSGVAIAEYQKAIEMAQAQGSNDMLKEIYLQQIMEYVQIRSLRAHENAPQAIENYLKLDNSNPKAFACLGVVCIKNHDNKGAIENFQKSLELNKKDHEVGVALLQTLFKMKDYEGMISQIEYYGITTVGSWLRDGYSIDDHRALMHAARAVKKIDMVIECYKYEIQNIQLSDDDLQAVRDVDLVKTAQQTLLYRKKRAAISSMFRVYLGWLYLEVLGQPDEAFELWKTAFFQRSEFFNCRNLYGVNIDSRSIPDFFALFSQLIYEKALDPDLEVASQMVSHLEHLHRCEKVYWKLEKYSLDLNLRNMNLLLARLYLKHGRKDEARRMLNDQFQSAIDILEDSYSSNDRIGYCALAAILFLNGQLEKAAVASSLQRFSEIGFGFATEEGEHEQRLEICASRYSCENESREIPRGATVFTCTTCANVSFCTTCYNNLRKDPGRRKIFVCNSNHEFIKTPPDGLEKIKDQKITMNGKTTTFVDWLAEVRKEWKTGLCFKS